MAGIGSLSFILFLLLAALVVPMVVSKAVLNRSVDNDESRPDRYHTPPHFMSDQMTYKPSEEFTTNSSDGCVLRPTDLEISSNIRSLENNGAKLLRFDVKFDKYDTNPLLTNMSNNFASNRWIKAVTNRGKTLLSLPFNYEMLSLTMLSFGTHNMTVKLVDYPNGCFIELTSDQKLQKIAALVLSDFKNGTNDNQGNGHACHQRILNDNRRASFRYQCFQRFADEEPLFSTDVNPDSTVYTIVVISKVLFFLFWPHILIYFISTRSVYTVKLEKAMKISVEKVAFNKKQTSRAALVKDFQELRENQTQTPDSKVVTVNSLHITVKDKQLVTSSGLLHFLPGSIMYTLEKDEWYRMLTDGKLYSCICKKFSWGFIRRYRAYLLVAIAVCLPFILRLFMFYKFEETEVIARHHAVDDLHLIYPLVASLIHMVDSTVFVVCVYSIYAFACVAFLILWKCVSDFDSIAMGALSDLKSISRVSIIQGLLAHILIPFLFCGLFAFFIGVFYWMVVLPIYLLVILVYFTPMIYLVLRFIFPSKPSFLKEDKCCYGLYFLDTISPDNDGDTDSPKLPDNDGDTDNPKLPDNDGETDSPKLTDNDGETDSPKLTGNDGESDSPKFTYCILVGASCIILLLNITLQLVEAFGFIVEIIAYTTIGLITNFFSAFPYMQIVFWISFFTVYCFKNPYTRYKDFHSKIIDVLRDAHGPDLENVTNQTAEEQVNTAFRYKTESSPTVEEDRLECSGKKVYWNTKSLGIFVNTFDEPHISKALFSEICNAAIPGCPGPVYISFLESLLPLGLMIGCLLFLFYIEKIFGDDLSSANQLLLAVAGGLFPLLLKFVTTPEASEINVTSLAFKAKFLEIMQKFEEIWPVHDQISNSSRETKDDVSTDNSVDNRIYIDHKNKDHFVTKLIEVSSSSDTSDDEHPEPWHGSKTDSIV